MRWLMPLALLVGLSACGEKGTDDTAGATTDSGSPDAPDPEADCDDGADNDGDGATDCDDSDCAAAFECTYPDAIGHTTAVEFDGYEVECETWLGTFDEQIDDCATLFSIPLTVATSGDLCAECDLTFTGPITYDFDDCDELTGDSTRPTEGWFGFVFIDENSRELWSQDESGAWAYAVTMKRSGKEWTFAEGGEVVEDVDECDNSPLTLGMLTVTMTFIDQ